MSMNATTSAVWMATGWTMLHLVWAGTLLGVIAAMARYALRAARPETRYAVALSALLLLAASPFALFAALYEPPAAIAPAPVVLAAPHSDSVPVVVPEAKTPPPPLARPVEPAEPAMVPSRVEALVPYLPWLWMSGTLVTLAMLAAGLIGVEGLRRSGRALDDGPIAALVRDLSASLGITRRVALGVCARITSPVLVGIVRPMILLPPAALGAWGLDQVEMVLLHELAHLRRRDNLVNLVQRVAESLLFFHPVTWWLSSWVRLERELCCDRLVVDHVGKPRAYAEMLLTLTGPSSRGRRSLAATGMADGSMRTRVRRLLNLEDRSMTLSLPEGLGIAGALALLAALALGSGTRAEPPPDRDATKTLTRQVIANLEALRGPENRDLARLSGLTAAAQAQLRLGDREAGLATLQRVFETVEHRFDEPGSLADKSRKGQFIPLAGIISVLRNEGETETARALLDRVTKRLDAQENPPPAPVAVDPNPGQVGPFSDKAILASMRRDVARERLQLGDRDEALRLYRHAIDLLKDESPRSQALSLSYICGDLQRAGDPFAARVLIERVRTLADQVTAFWEREEIERNLTLATAQAGDLDGALARLVVTSPVQPSPILDDLLGSMTEPQRETPWYAPGPIRVTIGADRFKITDAAASRRDLPRYASALARVDSPLTRSRMLARIAHLQAKAGDFDGARKTVGMMPSIRREDYPDPNDGFYDAVRPVTIALIARERAQAGDRARAEAEFQEARDAARAIANAGEKTVALMVLGRERARIGDRAAALDVLNEVEPLVQNLPEPRRSRSLAMIVDARVKAGDLPGATAAADAIRSYPKSEKRHALQAIAEAHRQAGDIEDYRTFLRQELAVCDAEPPKDAKRGPFQYPNRASADTFLDPDLDLLEDFDSDTTRVRAITLCALLDGLEAALKRINALPPDNPNQRVTLKHRIYGPLAGTLARQGDLDGAETILNALPDSELKLTALSQFTYALNAIAEK